MPIRCNPRFVHPIENVTVWVRMVERKIPTNNVIHVAVMVVIYAVSFFIKTSPCPPDIYVDTFFRIDLFHRRLVGPSIDSELPARIVKAELIFIVGVVRDILLRRKRK